MYNHPHRIVNRFWASKKNHLHSNPIQYRVKPSLCLANFKVFFQRKRSTNSNNFFCFLNQHRNNVHTLFSEKYSSGLEKLKKKTNTTHFGMYSRKKNWWSKIYCRMFKKLYFSHTIAFSPYVLLKKNVTQGIFEMVTTKNLVRFYFVIF